MILTSISRRDQVWEAGGGNWLVLGHADPQRASIDGKKGGNVKSKKKKKQGL